jgi:large subunit ribosomal protein L32
MRNAHRALEARTLAVDPTTGETHIRHHITPDGYYRGKKVLLKAPVEDQDDTE